MVARGPRALDAQREREGRPVRRALFEACRRLERELDADRAPPTPLRALAGARRRRRRITADGARHGQAVRSARAADGVDECHRWSAPPSANWPPLASAIPTSCSLMPATGISARCSSSPAKASPCSSHPTPGCAEALGRAGPAAWTHSCAACSKPPRPEPLPAASDHDRARVRPDQVQPRDQTLPTPWQNRLPQRMETSPRRTTCSGSTTTDSPPRHPDRGRRPGRGAAGSPPRRSAGPPAGSSRQPQAEPLAS